jgi:hypothetical protein
VGGKPASGNIIEAQKIVNSAVKKKKKKVSIFAKIC